MIKIEAHGAPLSVHLCMRQTHIQICSMANLESPFKPVNLVVTWMSLDCGWTCKLHTEGPGIEPRAFLLDHLQDMFSNFILVCEISTEVYVIISIVNTIQNQTW